jgi:hypothetical protein
MKVITGFIITFLLLSNSWSRGQEGHGGDIIVSEFLILATEVGESLKGLGNSILPTDTFVEQYEEALLNTKVSSADRVYLGEQEVDAINFPYEDNPKIIVARERWLDNRINNIQRKRLVLHEYLSIMGYDDQRYQLSYPIIKKIVELDSAHLNPQELTANSDTNTINEIKE